MELQLEYFWNKLKLKTLAQERLVTGNEFQLAHYQEEGKCNAIKMNKVKRTKWKNRASTKWAFLEEK